jgi:RpiR family transcriptional regulator, carbohydrate utilization regulator
MAKNRIHKDIQSELVTTTRIFTLTPHFTQADQLLADLTINHPQTVIKLSAREFGRQCGVSEASVIRFVQKLGYEGLTEFKSALHHELVISQNPAWPEFFGKDTPSEALSKVVNLCSQTLQSLMSVLDPNELARAAEVINNTDAVHFFSAGGSIRVAQHAVFKLLRMGYLAIGYSEQFTQMAQTSVLTPKSVAFGISFTGSTKSVCDALAAATEAGAHTIGLTNFAGTPMTGYADIKLITGAPGGLLAANSAHARVAQFVVLDALFSLVSIRNGGGE